jgi:tripartite ATP-independent transporter DctM subunit
MIELSPELVTIVMLGGLLIGVFSGFPLAYIVGFLGLVMGFFVWQWQAPQLIYMRAYTIMLNYSLLAIPLFVFMGTMLEYSGIVEKLYDALYLWLGGLRGGLAIVTIIVGVIMAATVGIITASVTLLTLVALPSMVKRGYDHSLAAGACVAGGVLGILIPPSIMIVIYGPMANVSVGKLFFGAFLPGFMLGALYIIYVAIRSLLEPKLGPPVPVELRKAPLNKKLFMLLTSLVPPVILVISVLGVIYLGIAAPTEAAAMGAFAATLLTIAYRRFTWKVLQDTMQMTVKLCGFILFVGAMSFAFTGVFIGAGGGEIVTNVITAAPGGVWGAFFVMQFIVFFLGFFIDWIGIVFIMIPIISIAAQAIGFDPVWFAVMTCVNLQTSFITPPFAMALYICKGVADPSLDVKLSEIIRGAIPYVALILAGMALCIAFPGIITWLPGQMLGK